MRTTKIIKAEVVRINSLGEKEMATLRLKQNKRVEIGHIEVPRLEAAKIAYAGARFNIHVQDRGAVRTITIKPDSKANKKSKLRLQRLIDKL